MGDFEQEYREEREMSRNRRVIWNDRYECQRQIRDKLLRSKQLMTVYPDHLPQPAAGSRCLIREGISVSARNERSHGGKQEGTGM